MEQLAMDANMNMLTGMLSTCKNKTMKLDHRSSNISEAEKQAFQNCLQKFSEAPNIVM